MTPSELDTLRYNLTCKGKEWARNNYTRKDVIKEKETAVIGMLRSEEFLAYMQSIMTTPPSTMTTPPPPPPIVQVDPMTGRKVPVADIDFDSYMPYKWGSEYVEISDEARDLEHFIMNTDLPYLIESEKGMGKTLLVTDIALKHNRPLVTLSCSSGTKISDLEGRIHVDERGSYYQLGIIPLAIELANKYGHAILFLDEVNALETELQKRLNPVLDERRNILVNGKLYKLNEKCKLSVVGAMNPSTYGGVNTLNEDTKSRFIGRTWRHGVKEQLDNVIDWSNVSAKHRESITLLCDNIRSMRVSGKLTYSLSTRDIKQLVNVMKTYHNIKTEDEALSKALETCVLNHKFDNVDERVSISKLIYDIFAINIQVDSGEQND